MKHAFLITAYKDIPSLNRLIDRLSSDFYLYIHIDKKSSIRKSDIQKISMCLYIVVIQ